MFLGSYPIIPASDILHELSRHKGFGVTTFQAEDEISGVGAALGASFGGALGVTTTSGPGIALKSETIGMAVALEPPLLVVDVQRSGPSTGLPTKTEQADLLQATFGRNGEAPVPIIAPRSPGDCFHTALEAVSMAVTYRTPVLLLSDGSLANGSEPWQVPDAATLPRVDPGFATEPNAPDGSGEFWPYQRDADTLARPWAARHAGPGAPGRRAGEGRRPRNDLLRPGQPRPDGPAARREDRQHHRARRRGRRPQRGRGPARRRVGVGSGRWAARSRPRTCATSTRCRLLRARYLVDARSYTKVSGLPFKAGELQDLFLSHLDGVFDDHA